MIALRALNMSLWYEARAFVCGRLCEFVSKRQS